MMDRDEVSLRPGRSHTKRLLMIVAASLIVGSVIGLSSGTRDYPISLKEDSQDTDEEVEDGNSKEIIEAVHPDTPWFFDWTHMVGAVVLFTAAVIAPFVVKFVLYLLETKHSERSQLRSHSSEDGPFIDPKYALWRDINEFVGVPLGCGLFTIFAGAGIALMRLPRWHSNYPLRDHVTTIVWVLLLVTGLWIWLRAVDVIKMGVGRQAWVQRSKMYTLYDEVATKFAYLVKFIGALVVIIVISSFWGSLSEFSSQSMIASLSVAALGSLAFVGNMFKGTLRQYKAGIDIMDENLFNLGDEIEVFGRNWGRVRGVVAYMESRFCIIVGADGKKLWVPTEFLPVSCLINHTRSVAKTSLDLQLAYDNPAAKLRDFKEKVTEAIAGLESINREEQISVSFGQFTPASLPFRVSATAQDPQQGGAVKEELLLLILEICQREGVKLAPGGPLAPPEKATPFTSFSQL